MEVYLLLFLMPSLSQPWPVSQEFQVPQEAQEDILDMTLIHVNDFHAHFQETSVLTSRCREGDQCYGGLARLHYRQQEIRKNDPEALFLNAGDVFQGTSWYTKLRYGPMVELGNLMNYTAMGVGNHDFDDQLEGFLPFSEQVNYPLLGANIRSNDGSFLEGIHYNKSMVITVKGRQVGIVGYVTTSTMYNFPNHQVSFTDEVESVREEAMALAQAGIDIIIALGHSGYEIDQKLAREVPELDLVVGGHSHTFLYTPTADKPVPSIETPKGEYPTYITQDGGKVVPVVQAYCYTKYLGHLKLKFDRSGDLVTPVQTQGVVYAEPELMSDMVPQSSIVLEAMEKWRENLTEFQEHLGFNEVVLEEGQPSEESNLGDVVADAFAAAHPQTRIAFSNNGGLRSSLEVGDILYDDIVYILPFDDPVDLVTIKGQGIKNVLEKATQWINPDNIHEYHGSFGYQVAGLNFEVVVTPSNSGDRVRNLRVKGEGGEYEEIQMDTIYNVSLPRFLAGDVENHRRQVKSRGIFDDEIITHIAGNQTIYQALRQFVKTNSPIHQERYNSGYSNCGEVRLGLLVLVLLFL